MSTDLKSVIDRLQTSIAIAQWDAARDILTAHNGNLLEAELTTIKHIGHGINTDTAHHLVYLMERLVQEDADKERRGR